MKSVKIYTDGACSGNPGPGGWGVLLEYNGTQKKLSGAQAETTNNRMELTAAIEGLSALKEDCRVTIFSDSKYLVDAVTKGWVYKWRDKGWMKSAGQPTPNSDLWQKLLALTSRHKVEFKWVRGHSGHTENEICDALATEAIKNMHSQA